jgi:hypothetical protein
MVNRVSFSSHDLTDADSKSVMQRNLLLSAPDVNYRINMVLLYKTKWNLLIFFCIVQT